MTGALLLVLAFAAGAGPIADTPRLSHEHARVLAPWLRSNRALRLATVTDCGGCREMIRYTREGDGGIWVPVPGYHPYYATGDFNSDGKGDFAVAVVDAGLRGKKRFRVVVFDGPFGDTPPGPAFVSEPLDLRGSGLFFGPPRPKPHRLLVGRFESEGILLVPDGKGYAWEPPEED